MLRLLPFILVPVILVGGLWFWRSGIKQNLTSPQAGIIDSGPVEVPKALPGATLEDRVKSLEETLTKLVTQVNSIKSGSATPANLSGVEGTITELKARVTALEKATPVPAVISSKATTIYIPLGGSTGPWGSQDWNTINEYEISLNPDNYPGYTSMYLEVNFRLAEAAGTGSVRLYNTTDSSAVSSQVDTTSTAFGVQTSSSFKLSSGTKTYKLQIKSSQGKDLYVQSARIKVNF